ncbi:AraC family transcriptional regulator ligand-binding domain-containing protein [Fulvimarina sp. MAC8]|uniref:AraC family transcriptional regulator n=1 Tax=Fulvimarina sp. MAC8 TaxID=3162874 RepID=UPI0032ED8FB2
MKRVFQRVDLPLKLLDEPDLPFPLKVQFSVLSEAGREIGDPFFGASLGRFARMEKLSAFGAWVSGAATLGGAIDRSNRGLNRYFQTATALQLRVFGNTTRWSIEFLDPGRDGRFQNELLGVSYLIDGVRYFAGPRWMPALVRSTCRTLKQAAALEEHFGASVLHGCAVTAVEFDTALLTARRWRRPDPHVELEPLIPLLRGSRAEVTALLAIALLEGHPKIDWVASKLETNRRALQRSLDQEGFNFSGLLEELLKERAITLLRSTDLNVTDVALQLGYSDSAHFSRAFRRWTGTPPCRYRSEIRLPNQ